MEDMAMRTTDFSPFFRSSVGFDRIFDLLENASRVQSIDNWPPYDIVRAGEDTYRISMAVAGFTPDELNLTYKPNLLVVSGSRAGKDDGDYLHRGIANRAFERRFELADFVEVANANLENGLLTIELKREVPEEMKPRQIQIGTVSGQQQLSETRQIEEQQQQAA
jgi:molecular chaperone IbpA